MNKKQRQENATMTFERSWEFLKFLYFSEPSILNGILFFAFMSPNTFYFHRSFNNVL